MATADVAMPTAVLSSHDVNAPHTSNTFPSPIPRIKPRRASFEPTKHLAFTAPTSCYTMEDLGLPTDHGISPIAVTAPFQLFSPEGVRELRRDILSRECLENWSVSSSLCVAIMVRREGLRTDRSTLIAARRSRRANIPRKSRPSSIRSGSILRFSRPSPKPPASSSSRCESSRRCTLDRPC